MSRNNHETVEKLRRQAIGERSVGNNAAADSCERKIAELERKHSLVPVQKVDSVVAARRRVEEQWEAIAPDSLVIVLCIEPGLTRAVRRVMPMSSALPLLKNESARLVGFDRGGECTFAPQEVAPEKPLQQKTIWI
jgi:hypothetical protein